MESEKAFSAKISLSEIIEQNIKKDSKTPMDRIRSEREKALAGEVFRQGDPDMAKRRKRAKHLCFLFNHTDPDDEEGHKKLLEELIGSTSGEYCITAPFYCDYGTYISLGSRFFANYNCTILDGAPVVFGDDVRIGPDCTFVTPSHVPDPQMRKEGYEILLPIRVGNNVWFGAGVTVLGNVTIGDDSIIAAGSVVTRDIPSGVLAAGIPCRVIRNLDESDKTKYSREHTENNQK